MVSDPAFEIDMSAITHKRYFLRSRPSATRGKSDRVENVMAWDQSERPTVKFICEEQHVNHQYHDNSYPTEYLDREHEIRHDNGRSPDESGRIEQIVLHEALAITPIGVTHPKCPKGQRQSGLFEASGPCMICKQVQIRQACWVSLSMHTLNFWPLDIDTHPLSKNRRPSLPHAT